MRAMIADRRPQIVRPSSAWTFTGGAHAEQGVLTLPAVPSSGQAPLIPIRPGTVSATLSGDVLVPEGGDNRTYIQTLYYAADRQTRVPNHAGNTSNARAGAVDPGGWRSADLWPTIPLDGPDIRWMAIWFGTSGSYGTAGTMYRNLRVSFTM